MLLGEHNLYGFESFITSYLIDPFTLLKKCISETDTALGRI